MNFDYDFLTEIILVTVPTILAILGSKKILNSWQIRNEKSRIKRQILNEYENSSKYMRALLYNFIRKLREKYTIPALDDKTHGFVEYVEIKDKQIYTEFSEDYEKLWKELEQIEFTASKLISSLRLYYKNEELVDEHREILGSMSYLLVLIKKTLRSNSVDDFDKYTTDFLNKEKELRKSLQEFEMKLINTNLDKSVI